MAIAKRETNKRRSLSLKKIISQIEYDIVKPRPNTYKILKHLSEPRHQRIWISKNLRLIKKPYGITRTMEHRTGTVITRMIVKIMKLNEKNLKQF